MVFDLRIRGAEEVRQLGRALRAAGEEGKVLRSELRLEIKALEQPLVDAAKRSALDKLPHAGGANEYFAKSIKVRTRFAGKLVGTSIVSRRGHAMDARDDKGALRHPPFGHRDRKWTETKVPADWFSGPLRGMSSTIQLALWRAIQTTQNKIGR